MNVFWREMRAYRKALIFWSIGMIALIASSMGKYAGFSSSGQSLNDLVSAMPKVLQTFMGVGSLDISTASGYYGLVFMYILLLATIHAALIGATIVSKEERDKTVEFLFVKPVTRKKVVAMKLLAALTNAGILTLITWITSLFFVGYYGEGESTMGEIGLLMVGMAILQVLFLVIGTAVAAVIKRPEKASMLVTSILLITFIVSFMIDLSGKIDGLKYLTPFKYYEAKNMLYEGGVDPVFTALSVVIIVALGFITFWFYDKRDLKV